MVLTGSKSRDVILIGAAFKAEINPLIEKLSQTSFGPTGIDFDYILTGSGLERVRCCLAEKVVCQDYLAIINIGTAGVLNDTCPLMSIFYPHRFCTLSNDHLTYLTLPNDFLESSHFLSTGWKSGTLFSSREPVTSAAKRRAILQNSQADVRMAPKDGKALMILTLAAGNSLDAAAQGTVQENQLVVVESKKEPKIYLNENAPQVYAVIARLTDGEGYVVLESGESAIYGYETVYYITLQVDEQEPVNQSSEPVIDGAFVYVDIALP